MKNELAPICPYCGKWSKKVNGDTIYPHRKDLYKKVFYLCEPCDAYVGCHPNTTKPLGRLANEELRKAKSSAHMAFDKLWRGGNMSRGKAYQWLQRQLKLPAQDCHIGMFDIETCKKVVQVSKDYFNPFKEDIHES